MDLLHSNARNQHYIAQCEQRLNAINPDAERSSRRIYSLRVLNREGFLVTLDGDDGVPIKTNLSFDDLYSLDVQGRMRLNLESSFQRYERDVATHTRELLNKADVSGANITIEFLALFKSKFLNLLRNPYSVRKVCNILGAGLQGFVPVDDPAISRAFELIGLEKDHHGPVAQAFGLTHDEYRQWLRALVLMMEVDVNGSPIFDRVVHGMFASTLGGATLFRYSENRPDAVCVLSDRGLNDQSPGVPNQTAIIWDFNLCSRVFMRVVLVDPGKMIAHEVPHLSSDAVEHCRKSLPSGRLNVNVVLDNYEMLANFNQNAVCQCAKGVFSAIKDPFGLTIARSAHS